MFTQEDIPAIITQLMERLKALPEGALINTARLLKEAGIEYEDYEPALFELHNALMKSAKAYGLFLDMSSHEGKFEGLLYNLSFQVHHLDRKTIKQITIKSESGYVPVHLAYHDRLTFTKNSVRYKYDPWVGPEINSAWQWSYSTEDPSFRRAFDELEKIVLTILD